MAGKKNYQKRQKKVSQHLRHIEVKIVKKKPSTFSPYVWTKEQSLLVHNEKVFEDEDASFLYKILNDSGY